MYPSERIDDIITKDTAEELGISRSIVDVVNKFQWKSANDATKLYTSVEITDIGILKTSQKKITNKIETFKRKKIRLTTIVLSTEGKKKITLEKKLIDNDLDISYLEGKIKKNEI